MKRIIGIIVFTVTISILMFPSFTPAEFYVIPVNKSPMAGPKKSLCEFPFGQDGNFEVKYDFRGYDPDYNRGQYPAGGIKFELFLGLFASEQQRDDLTNRITKVMFYNKDTDTYYERTQPFKYSYIGFQTAEYGIWIGNQGLVLGDWDIVIDMGIEKYSASYTLTQDMLDKIRPIPVNPEVSFDGANYTITADVTNGDYYRFRVFDIDGNFIVNENMTVNGGIATSIVSKDYAGYSARIETRFSSGDYWVALMEWGNPSSCNSNGCVVGAGSARALINFRIEEIP